MKQPLAIAGLWLVLLCAGLAEKMPPKPARYFNDYARVVPAATAAELDERLRQFERESSNQVVVAVFPKMESESSVEDYTNRVAESWKVGQKGLNNGAVLFVFIQDRTMYLQVGYGLEGVLPDALAKRIIAEEITPAFKKAQYDAGLRAGVEAIIKATRGEYHGSGTVAGDRGANRPGDDGWLLVLFIFLFFFLVLRPFFRGGGRGVTFGPSGRRSSSSGGWGGSWGGGGGGGFSGGGGSFGGGGAGGKW